MPARSFEEIVGLYQVEGTEEFEPRDWLLIYLWVCFAPKDSNLLYEDEEFDPDQMKQGLKLVEWEVGQAQSEVFTMPANYILIWIRQIWDYITKHEPNNADLIQPLLDLLSLSTVSSNIREDEKHALSALVSLPDQSIDLQFFYRMSQTQTSIEHHAVHSYGNLRDSFSKFVYVTLLNLLTRKYNNGESFPFEEVSIHNVELQKLIYDNRQLFEPWTDIIGYYQRSEWIEAGWPRLLESPSTDYKWIDVILDDLERFNQELFWIWREDRQDNEDLFSYDIFKPGYITEANLIAIYAVGAAFVKFDITLLLYLFPDTPFVNEFWKRYGEAIVFLQELYDAYSQWKSDLYWKSLLFSNNLLVEMSKICNRLATRMVNDDTFDRLRSQLVDLENKAVVEGVPLKLLFKNMPIQKVWFKNGKLYDISKQSYMFEYVNSNKMLTSSVWYFDFLRAWWDSICKSTLETRLRELIADNMPQELKQQDLDADRLLADSLRQIAMYGPKAAGSQARHNIRHAKLPRDIRRSLLETLNKITNNESAIGQLTYLGEAVKTGMMSQGIAEMELMDFIDRWREKF